MRISDWSSDVCSSDLPILQKLGYTKGSVGDRMNALAQDPRFKFPDNDQGRAEIVAYIQTWLGQIRAQLPRALDRKSVGSGQRVSASVARGGCRVIKKKK